MEYPLPLEVTLPLEIILNTKAFLCIFPLLVQPKRFFCKHLPKTCGLQTFAEIFLHYHLHI